MGTVSSRLLPCKKGGQATKVWQVTIGSGASRQRKNFATKKQAEAYNAEMTSRINAGLISNSGAMTLHDLWKLYDDHCSSRVERRENLSLGHLEGIRLMAQNYILSSTKVEPLKGSRRRPFDRGIGHLKLSALTAARVEQWKDDMREAGVGVSTTKSGLRILGAALEFARRRDYMRVNPARNIRIHARREDASRKVVPPSTALLGAMIEQCHHRTLRGVILVLSMTALRISELYALRWSDIDFDRGALKVQRRVSDQFRTEDLPKTDAGIRTIPLGKACVNVLKEHRRETSHGGADDLVFCAGAGQYRRAGNDRKQILHPLYQKVIGSMPAEHRMPDDRIGFHALRHYAISAWIDAGLSAKVVSTLAGHASIAITMDRYGHMFPSEDHGSAMDRIGEALNRQ